MKNKTITSTLGIVIMLFAIWGSAFAVHLSGWIEVPSVLTGMLIFGVGLAVAVNGSHDWDNRL